MSAIAELFPVDQGARRLELVHLAVYTTIKQHWNILERNHDKLGISKRQLEDFHDEILFGGDDEHAPGEEILAGLFNCTSIKEIQGELDDFNKALADIGYRSDPITLGECLRNLAQTIMG